MKAAAELRPSSIAGRWYPGEAHRLVESVDGYVSSASLPYFDGQVVAVVAPHAGHLYSGPVAGYAFAALQGLEPQIVAVISPMHYPYPHPLMTSAHAAYQTPLGAIPIDKEAVQRVSQVLMAELGFGLVEVAHDPEHSLEIELPFLQRVLTKEFNLLPVMVAEPTVRVTRALGHALAGVLGETPSVLVASTDLSHFYPQTLAEKLDAEMLRYITALDPEGVLRVEEEGKGFACGRGAVAAVLWAAKAMGADQAVFLHHATSGDITGDYSEVVGYGAVVITKHG